MTIDKITFTEDEISFDIAEYAYRGTSFRSEDRAKSEQRYYVANMHAFYDDLWEKSEDKEAVNAAILIYKARYIEKKHDMLCTRSRCLSTMITGPANFPVARVEKANRSYSNKSDAFDEWREKAQKRIRKNLGLIAPSFISSDDSDAVTKLETKISDLEALQSAMKLANKEHRRTKGDIEAMNVDESMKERLRGWKENGHAAYADKPFQGFSLTNNNANIKRYKQRLLILKREQSKPDNEISFDGGTYIDNAEDNRIQLLFDGKPDEETRKELKSRGFRWTPSKGVWQRQRTNDARYAAKKIAGIDLDAPAIKKEVPVMHTDSHARRLVQTFAQPLPFQGEAVATKDLKAAAKDCENHGADLEEIADYIVSKTGLSQLSYDMRPLELFHVSEILRDVNAPDPEPVAEPEPVAPGAPEPEPEPSENELEQALALIKRYAQNGTGNGILEACTEIIEKHSGQNLKVVAMKRAKIATAQASLF